MECISFKKCTEKLNPPFFCELIANLFEFVHAPLRVMFSGETSCFVLFFSKKHTFSCESNHKNSDVFAWVGTGLGQLNQLLRPYTV